MDHLQEFEQINEKNISNKNKIFYPIIIIVLAIIIAIFAYFYFSPVNEIKEEDQYKSSVEELQKMTEEFSDSISESEKQSVESKKERAKDLRELINRNEITD